MREIGAKFHGSLSPSQVSRYLIEAVIKGNLGMLTIYGHLAQRPVRETRGTACGRDSWAGWSLPPWTVSGLTGWPWRALRQ